MNHGPKELKMKRDRINLPDSITGGLSFKSHLKNDWVAAIRTALDYTSHVLENMKYIGMMLGDRTSLLKTDFIAEKDFRRIATTGDIILLRTPTIGNHFQRFLTRGKYGKNFSFPILNLMNRSRCNGFEEI